MRKIAFGFLAVLGMSLPACGEGADVGDDAAEDVAGPEGGEELELGQVSQALGGFSVLFSAPDAAEAIEPRHLGSNYGVFWVAGSSGCDYEGQFWMVDRATGFVWVAQFDHCTPPDGVGSDADTMWVADQTMNQIRVFDGFGFSQVATTGPWPRGTIYNDNTNVYWADQTGIRRAPKFGGATTTLKTGAAFALLGLDGSTLYYRFGTELRSIQTNGTNDRFLHTLSFMVDAAVSFDATHLYVVNYTYPNERIERISKSSLSVQTMAESPYGPKYYHPMSNGSMLYWLEDRGTTTVLRRRNLSNGNIVSVTFKYPNPPEFMKVHSNALSFMTTEMINGESTDVLLNGQL